MEIRVYRIIALVPSLRDVCFALLETSEIAAVKKIAMTTWNERNKMQWDDEVEECRIPTQRANGTFYADRKNAAAAQTRMVRGQQMENSDVGTVHWSTPV